MSEVKKKRRNHSKLGSNFIAPDGGFGWFICLAAGCSNLCTFHVLQQFGLIFRERLKILNIPSAEITTMINLNQALTCLIGLANGPVFRRFTFRQVSFFGATLVSIALFFTSFADSFLYFVITFSILYGAGVGLTTSANSLALNTYFKEKRRIVTGISWTCTGFGPIVFPHIVNFLIPRYGVQGTVLIFSGFAMNAIACALLLQPVRWHVKKRPKDIDNENMIDQKPEIECQYCQSLKMKPKSLMSSQYLHNVDDYLTTGYEIIDPGTPMIARANDGWFSSSSAKRSLYSSKMSLTSKKSSRKTSYANINLSSKPSNANFDVTTPKRINNEKIEECPSEDCPSHKSPQDLKTSNGQTSSPSPTTNQPPLLLKQVSESKYLKDNKSNRSMHSQSFRSRINTFNLENEVLKIARNKLEKYVDDEEERMLKCNCEELRLNLKRDKDIEKEMENEFETNKPKFTLWEKVVVFFDLNLLKDLTFINIMVGITIANFAELNFSVLTPFVLADFGIEKQQVAVCMSLLALTDIGVRFFIPFIAGKIGWENRTFFLVGVLGMAFGRIVLAHFNSYPVALAVSLWIGFNKGLRTVFMVLCIPSHVPLDRLPSATGLHLLFSGIFYIIIGPVVGFVRDRSDYATTLHFLNLATYLCAISWGIEKLIKSRKNKNNN